MQDFIEILTANTAQKYLKNLMNNRFIVEHDEEEPVFNTSLNEICLQPKPNSPIHNRDGRSAAISQCGQLILILIFNSVPQFCKCGVVTISDLYFKPS